MSLAFWAIAALLLAGGLLFVLPPLLRSGGPTAPRGPEWTAVYREQRAELDAALAEQSITAEEHAAAMLELEHRVVEEAPTGGATAPAHRAPMAAMLAVALAVPAGALALYGLLGKPQALAPEARQAATQGEAPHTMSREQMEQMVERLAERMKQSPNDADGWHMLARSYVAFGRLPEAAQAYDNAAKLSPQDPQLLADYADTLAMVNGRSLEGRPTELVQAALKVDPNHQKSLALAGTAAFNRGDFAQAVAHWKKLQSQLPPDSEGGRSIATSIAQAQAAMQGGGAPAAKPGAAPAKTAPAQAAGAGPAANTGAATAGAAGAGGVVEGTVTIADPLRARVGPNDTLFVFARPSAGSGMPLAIQRVGAAQLPFKFKLDDSSAMTPQTKISGQQQVMLAARISRSGNATPQSGDLLGTLGPVAVGSRDVRLVIDGVVP